MYDPSIVQIFYSLEHLVHILGSFALFKSSFFFLLQLLGDLPTRCEFQNQVYFLLIPEESIELTYIIMPQVALNFNLLPQLVLFLAQIELLLVKHFQSYNKLASLFSGKVDMTTLTSPQRLANFEIGA